MKIGSVQIERYRKGGYNSPSTNERTVELPLGFYFLDKFPEAVELGAVMPYYGRTDHEIWDLHDPHPSCQKIDFSSPDFSIKDRDILSISTVEHVGFNNYTEGGYLPKERWAQAFHALKIITENARNYLVTFPLGYNLTLDEMVEASSMPRVVLNRLDAGNNWDVESDGSMRYHYGTPQSKSLWEIFNDKMKQSRKPARFNNANAVCIVTNVKEFF